VKDSAASYHAVFVIAEPLPTFGKVFSTRQTISTSFETNRKVVNRA
jgi:hypothetical protein